MRVFVVTGGRGAGKTTMTWELAGRLRARGLQVLGFVQRRLVRAGRAVGYELVDLRSDERRLLCARRRGLVRRMVSPKWREEVSWWCDERGFEWARTLREGRGDVAVVDELGSLELKGGGHWPAVARFLAAGRAPVAILSVQWNVLDGLATALGRVDAWGQVAGARGSTGKENLLRHCERWERLVLGALAPGLRDEKSTGGAPGGGRIDVE